MDTLGTLLVGWLLFVTFALGVAKFLYNKFLRPPQIGADAGDGDEDDDGGVAESREPPDEGAVKVKARKATIVPDAPGDPVSSPVGAGADPDAVRWVNNVFTWVYNAPEGGTALKDVWLDTLNEYTVSVALETGVLVEVLEVLYPTQAPTLTNVIVDCSPQDDITITCDSEAVLYLRLQTTRTKKDVMLESEYACAVCPLRGRLNVAAIPRDQRALAKFDGWPEVFLKLEGIRNNSEGLDEAQLQEVIKEVLSSGLRSIVLDINFKTSQTCPHFQRARQFPDPVIPVGYDSMVRELQTHPPTHSAKTPPKELVIIHEDILDEGGESFSSLSFPNSEVSNHMALYPVLTTSEEQLIVRQLEKYDRNDSVGDNINISQVIAAYVDDEQKRNSHRKSWEENYIPAGSAAENDVGKSNENEILPDSSSNKQKFDEEPSKRFVLVASNREKPIDEPRLDVRPTPSEEDEDYDDFSRNETTMREIDKVPRPLQLRLPFSSIEESEEEEEETKDPSNINEEASTSNEILPQSKVFGVPQVPFVTAHQTSSLSQPSGIPGLSGKRLLVKIIKAAGIGCDRPVGECYAVVEMDEPPQKFTTGAVKDTNSPFWDEQFLFDLTEGTLELLFELYNKQDGSFLGLGIVGIEELIATPSQRQIIPLQSRPYENDAVSGSLTVEFLFLDRVDMPELLRHPGAAVHSVSSRGDRKATAMYTLPQENKDFVVNGGEVVSGAFENDGSGPKVMASDMANDAQSTVVIHSSRKETSRRTIQSVDEQFPDSYPALSSNEDPSVSVSKVSSTISTGAVAPSTTPVVASSATTSLTTTSASGYNVANNSVNTAVEPPQVPERGRSHNKVQKRDSFLGSLKKRFSRSKSRSKSTDPSARDASADRDVALGRSISVERSVSVTRSKGLLSVPGTSGGGVDGGSTRSSLSETSGLSSSSTRTYINEASTLIIETLENGVLKYYLIPISLQHKSKWRKKGTKLHVFNEHTFVAKHMSSSTVCEVCRKTLGRRFGKQGYECRDCSYKCHKPCHVRTDTTCPNSTVNTMDLNYVKDPRAERRALLRSTKNQ